MSEVKDWMRKLDDPASKYAVKVLDGKIVAGEHMRNTCRRFFEDHKRKDYIWSPQSVRRPYEFMKNMCNVMDYDTYVERPIKLLPWQKFLLWNLHGWRVGHTDRNGRIPGARRFEKVFLTSAKNTGKSAFFAGHMLFILTQDGYRNLATNKWINIRQQRCVISASTYEQATEVALRPAIAMLESNPLLADPTQGAIELEGGIKRPKALFCRRTGGRLMVVTTRKEGTGLGGRIIHALHMEEITETNDFERWRSLEAGFKNSVQPLMSIATNPSPFSSGIAYREYTDARTAARGEGSDSLLSMIFSIDDDEVVDSVIGNDWVPAETSWVKANPGINDQVPRKDYILREIERATTPRERREVLRLNMGAWKSWGNGLLSLDLLNLASLPPQTPRHDDAKFDDMELWLGLDLARSNDLSALAYLWIDGPRQYLRIHSYLPEGRLQAVDSECSADLTAFVEAGWIQLTPGQSNDYQMIIADMVEARKRYDLQGICMDAWDFDAMAQAMDAQGIKYAVEGDEARSTGEGLLFVPHPQGWTYSKKAKLSQESSIAAMERLFSGPDGKPSILLERNPVLAHAVDSSVVKESEKLTRKVTKRDAVNANRGKIDALLALIMACGLHDRGLLADDKDYNPVGIYGRKDFDPNRFVM